MIGASLGQDNIQKGFKAVMLGLALVLLAAAIYYKLFGLVADIALFFNLVILVAVMSADRGHPDHAGHRRYRADPGHGDRRERADLRTRA